MDDFPDAPVAAGAMSDGILTISPISVIVYSVGAAEIALSGSRCIVLLEPPSAKVGKGYALTDVFGADLEPNKDRRGPKDDERLKKLSDREAVDSAGDAERSIKGNTGEGLLGGGQYTSVISTHSTSPSTCGKGVRRRRRVNAGQEAKVALSSCPSCTKGRNRSSVSMTSSFATVHFPLTERGGSAGGRDVSDPKLTARDDNDGRNTACARVGDSSSLSFSSSPNPADMKLSHASVVFGDGRSVPADCCFAKRDGDAPPGEGSPDVCEDFCDTSTGLKVGTLSKRSLDDFERRRAC